MHQIAELCHQQALQAKTICAPNPAVGAVIFGRDNVILGIGHTQKRGAAHAEIMALQDAALRGNDVRGSTIFVSLEPCSHQGRTGPCCEALINAGVRKVYASAIDPNPLVSGQGIAKLQAAGIEVHVGIGAKQTKELNIGFFNRMIHHRPWVRTKIAASIDGKTALKNGESKWITSQVAREDGHTWRAKSNAIVTGIGTVLKDNPRLDVRNNQVLLTQPLLAIADSRLETPVNSELFKFDRSVVIYGAVSDDKKQSALERMGAKVVILPLSQGAIKSVVSKVDLGAMLADLARQEVNEVHVEAGGRLNGALIDARLVDELILYLAPKLIGPGRDLVQLNPLTQLNEAVPFHIRSMDTLGDDIRIVGRFSKDNIEVDDPFN
jgi:diaminohydroxyphosphoribosylaminopyrimidine deaminase/5-amino-6-(5-phosphoribosylamino)uracil reductase